MKRNVLIGTGLLTLLAALGIGQPRSSRAAIAQTNGKTIGAALRSRSDVAQAAAESLGDGQHDRRRRRQS